jgi:chromosome segregation ATPase
MADPDRYAELLAPVVALAAEMAQDDKKSVQDHIDTLEARRHEIDLEIRQIRKHLDEIDSSIAVGLTHAAKDAGLKINLDAQKSEKTATVSESPTPATPLRVIIEHIPSGLKNALTIGQIKKALNVTDSKLVMPGLSKLLRNNTVRTFGQRRGKRYYRN